MKHQWHPRHIDPRPTQTGRRSRQAALVAGLALLLPVAVATPAQAAAQREQVPVVTVVHGQTLSGIAARGCGNAAKFRQLAAGNGIANPNLIYPGQRIRLTCDAAIPAPARSSSSASRSTTRTTTAAGWVNPLPGATLTSCYGMRWGSLHAGIDMAKPTGTPIRAAAAGVVTRTGWIGSGYGIEVVISHGNGIWTHYAHQSRVAVHAGQTVAAGQTIGYVGATGQVTGPHLHFEVARAASIFGHQINPAPYLRARGVSIGC